MDRLVNLRTKELVIVAGAPGAGKSALAIALSMAVDFPVLYIAQDSPASVASRMMANVLNRPVRTVQREVERNPKAIEMDIKSRIPSTKLVLATGPHTVDMVRDEILAMREWLGISPPMVVIDNLIDMKSEKGSSAENIFYSDVLLSLKQVAIELDTCIVVLHHVVRGDFSHDSSMGRKRLRLRDLLFAGEREARHVWGVWNDGDMGLFLSVLKQQDGPADPYGTLSVRFRWDTSTFRMTEDVLERGDIGGEE